MKILFIIFIGHRGFPAFSQGPAVLGTAKT